MAQISRKIFDGQSVHEVFNRCTSASNGMGERRGRGEGRGERRGKRGEGRKRGRGTWPKSQEKFLMAKVFMKFSIDALRLVLVCEREGEKVEGRREKGEGRREKGEGRRERGECRG